MKNKFDYYVQCGDCLDILPDLSTNSIDMVLCDPPYGTTACKWDSIIPLEPMWKELKRVIKPNSVIVMTASQPFTSKLISSNYSMFKYCWIWEKPCATGFLNARVMPLKNYEDVCVFKYKGKGLYNPQMTDGKPYTAKSGRGGFSTTADPNIQKGGHITINKGQRFPLSIIRINNEKGLHPTQKPVPLMEYLIKTYTLPGQIVLDFAMGSGTTGVACKNTNRKFIGIELDEKYFCIAKKRLEGKI
jgi:DNA modification methylase